MQTINDLLDLAKSHSDIPTDRQLGLRLGMGSLTRYRKGHIAPSDKTAIHLAELSGMKPEAVVALCHAAKAESKEEKSVWSHIYKMAATASVVGFVSVSGGVSVVEASSIHSESVATNQILSKNVEKCILCKVYRKSIIKLIEAFAKISEIQRPQLALA